MRSLEGDVSLLLPGSPQVEKYRMMAETFIQHELSHCLRYFSNTGNMMPSASTSTTN